MKKKKNNKKRKSSEVIKAQKYGGEVLGKSRRGVMDCIHLSPLFWKIILKRYPSNNQ